jgi:hypothetical protein
LTKESGERESVVWWSRPEYVFLFIAIRRKEIFSNGIGERKTERNKGQSQVFHTPFPPEGVFPTREGWEGEQREFGQSDLKQTHV